MRLKDLEAALQDVTDFDNPNVKLEQYATSAHLASRMIYTAQSTYDDIRNKVVVDFGCGCGVLRAVSQPVFWGQGMKENSYWRGVATQSFPIYTIGLDIDSSALAIAQENITDFEFYVDLIQTDIVTDPLLGFRGNVDTIVMNPPFGTKNNKGIDMAFLKKAIEVADRAVYSVHKSATREYILKKAKEWNVECEVLAQLKFDIPMKYKFHRKESVDVMVDFLRLKKK
ncbi:87_t:CDS:2 [Paraglomus brasilianum]|uniref:Methyltransferase-like protein 5 n=1 Tax=Paraglomus brasilianum TaxID=144538 RepID=A0A9N8WIW1_9GLOM|nr:87_t:CDS:2 [Paraglomus brasilianum]